MGSESQSPVDGAAASLVDVVMGPTFLLRAAEVAAVCGAFIAGARPTTVGWWNVLLTAGLAWTVVWLGSQGRRWTWAFAAVAATLFAGISLWAVFGCMAILLGGWALRAPRRDRVVGAALLAITIQVALRLPAFGWFGTQSIVAVAAMTPALVSGFKRVGRRDRRTLRFAMTGLGLLTLIGVASAVFAGLTGYRSVSHLASLSDDAHSAAADADLDAARRVVEEAGRQVGDSDDAFNSPLAMPARLVPIASQHVSAAGSLAAAGRVMLADASTVTNGISAESLSAPGGIDLAQLQSVVDDLGRMNDGMSEVLESVDRVERNWLSRTVVEELTSARRELAQALDVSQGAHTLADASAVVFGADGPTRWFVMFGTPAEARELGGLMTAWAVIEANNGSVRIVETGNEGEINELVTSLGSQLTLPGEYGFWYPRYDLDQYPQNITGSPELAIVASAVEELFGSIGGAPLDGVLYADPEALEALVSLVGPVQLPTSDVVLTGENTASFLLRDQYGLFPDQDIRKQVLIEVLTGTFGQLLNVDGINVGEAAGSLQRVANERRLQMFAFDPAITEALIVANLYQPWVENSGDDFLAVLHTNGAPSKLDAWLDKSIVYRVQFDPSTGQRSGTVEVTLTSTVDETTPERVFGKLLNGREATANRVLLSIMTSGDAGTATIDGTPAAKQWNWTELGFTRDMASVDVPAGSSVTVVWPVTGKIRQGDYRLLTASQPSATEIEFELVLDVLGPWRPVDLNQGESDIVNFELTRNTAIFRGVTQGSG